MFKRFRNKGEKHSPDIQYLFHRPDGSDITVMFHHPQWFTDQDYYRVEATDGNWKVGRNVHAPLPSDRDAIAMEEINSILHPWFI